MRDVQETIDHVADLLQDFAKAKNFSPAEITAVRFRIHDVVSDVSVSPEAATAGYERACSKLLDKITEARGLPVQTCFQSGPCPQRMKRFREVVGLGFSAPVAPRSRSNSTGCCPSSRNGLPGVLKIIGITRRNISAIRVVRCLP